ncbi:nickel ABC transporter permease [Ruania alba]|uniref:Nickel import system permease protein NikB n=1 Tax=Ruania alba TaxID=648782 RepID=A0A1H5HQL1_9MICO|nr:nickel ABC transporter permease [Ruania alba]SEE30257.1 peptide/nickel transport system permease protein [Ruania alba]
MGAYLARRLMFSVFILWGAVSIIFVVLRLVPSDPARLILGSDATEAEVDALRDEMGLNDPLITQYGTYLGDLLRLDFGDSYRQQRDSFGLVMERLPATLELALVAMVIALVIGILLGVLAALRVNRLSDRIISVGSLLAQSLPSFWIGIVFILIFARGLGVLPSGGTGSPAHMVLPAITLAMPMLAILIRMTRSGLLEVIHEGYIQTARAKGLSERVVIFPHAIRNALIPIVTIVGLQFGGLLAGSVIVEMVFSWPGIGRLLIESIGQRDYNVVQASVLVIAAGFVVANLVVDVLYGYLDPRVRLVSR